MDCMKCGRETQGDSAFCPKCLEAMENRPVRPDVTVWLPSRQTVAPKKPVLRKKVLPPAEQLSRLKRKNRWLVAIICLLLVLSALLSVSSIRYLQQLNIQQLLGKNYSTEETVK